MKCNELVKGETGYLCGSTNMVYACSDCDETTRECKNCIPIPRIQPQYHREYGDMQNSYDGIMSYVTDKKFLLGVATGLLIGMVLFRK